MVRFRRILLMLAVAAMLAPGTEAMAQAIGSEPRHSVNVLDGQRFAGEFVPVGKTSGRPDEFVFSEGLFHSRECLAFGFSPGPYWVRTEGGRLRFFARLTSAENGVMTYEGTVSGAEIDARIDWIKPRWYWTMKRQFRFKGALGAPASANRQ